MMMLQIEVFNEDRWKLQDNYLCVCLTVNGWELEKITDENRGNLEWKYERGCLIISSMK